MGETGPLRLTLLGGFALSVGERTVPPSAWRLAKARDLVKMLALAPARRLHREQVLERLWPERDRAAGLNNLHQVLHAARHAVKAAGGDGHACLRLTTETLSLCPDGRLWVDADAFEELARAAVASQDPEQCRAALDLYGGELLPDDRYAEWTAGRREVLRGLELEVAATLARRFEAEGDLAPAGDLLRRIVAEDPANEAAHRNLMRVYALGGDRGAAARQFRILTQALRDELDVPPDEASVALDEDITAGRVAALTTSRPEGPATNVPAPLSSFVGRTRDLEELPVLLDENRLLTLVGPGGCGKTRLATELGRRCLNGFSGGVYLVELAATAGSGDVSFEAARSLGIRQGPDERSAMEALTERLGESRALLILDNCEHVVHAAARLVATLLGACPRLRVLATSREPLRVSGEVVRRVSSLGVPGPDEQVSLEMLAEYDAVRLFDERARAVREAFVLDATTGPLVAEICARVDGVPLALELAAARVAALPLSVIAEQLDDRFRLLTDGPRTAPARQQTLEATVTWSYDLLEPAERALFRRLSVFHGAFDLDAAAATAGAATYEMNVAALIARLVERSMIVADDGGPSVRYRLLETMRAYGEARLREHGELEDARTVHAHGLLELALRTAPGRAGAARTERFAQLDLAHDDLRPALEHLLATEPAEAIRLVLRLWPYCLWNDQIGEGLAFLRMVLEGTSGPSLERCDVLFGATVLSIRGVGLEMAEAYAARCVGEAEALGDPACLCRAWLCLGIVRWSRDDADGAERLFGEARDLAVRHECAPEAVAAMRTWAAMVADECKFDVAERLLAEAEDWLARMADDELMLNMVTVGAWFPMMRQGARRLMWAETFVPFEAVARQSVWPTVVADRGNLARLSGEPERARADLGLALELFRAVGDRSGEARAQSRLGQLAFATGAFYEARERLEESLAIRERLGEIRGAQVDLVSLSRVAAERRQLDVAWRYLERAATMRRARLDRPAFGLIRFEQGILRLAMDDPAEAEACLSEALAVARAHGHGLQVACVLRDLGQAQTASHAFEQAATSLREAAEIFDRHSHHEEAAYCRGILASEVAPAAGLGRA